MFEGRRVNWGWPAIIGVAVIAIAILQAVRVNRPRESILRDETRLYSQKGPVLAGTISIPPGEFYQTRINLNRRAKLVGEFQTPGIRDRVAAAVINEADIELWKAGADVKALAKVGYVPGGKISVALEPGVFLLVMDNRDGESLRVVRVDFRLE